MGCEYLSPREYAEFWGVHYNTVYHWIALDLLPGVIKQRIFVRTRYYIPMGTIPPRPYPGPKPERRKSVTVSNNHCDNFPGQMDMFEDRPPWEE